MIELNPHDFRCPLMKSIEISFHAWPNISKSCNDLVEDKYCTLNY